MSDPVESDVLVLGCGIAGGTAALELAEAGLDVVIVTRAGQAEESNTYWAQGGIIYTADGDSPELLARDIENAGAGICRSEAVQILARTGPPLVKALLIDKLRVPFDREPDGSLALGREGGHSLPRIVHSKDVTGAAIENALVAELRRHPRVRFLTGYTAVDLLTPAHHGRDRRSIYDPLSCVGAYVLEQATGRIVRCYSRATVLATGGLGQIFLRTTNPHGSRGDGLAMAYRAGARVINTEYVQFHPTAFYHRNAPCFLITEAVRGAGARLVGEDGVPFMDRYDTKWKDLAPRDVVARSILAEMLRRDVPNVYLDLRSYIPADRIRAEFPQMARGCQEFGIDITRDLVPVVPAAHYSCGGVWVDDDGLSTVQRLYAIGEVSCTGLHGANRLASTSLLEGLVWGHRSARHITRQPAAARQSAFRRDSAVEGDRPRDTGSGADHAGRRVAETHHVELRRTGAYESPPRPRDPRPAQPRGRGRALLSSRGHVGRPDRAAQRGARGADRDAGGVGKPGEPRLPLPRIVRVRECMKKFLKGLGWALLGLVVVGLYPGYRLICGHPFTINQLANRQAVSFLVRNPELLTTIGAVDGTLLDFHSGKLAPVGVAKRDEDYAWAEKAIAEVREFDRAKLGTQDQITYDILLDFYGQQVATKPFDWLSSEGLYPISPMFGTQVQLPSFLQSQHVIKNAKTARNYVARLQAMGGKLDGLTAEMQRQSAAGVVLPSSLLEKSLVVIHDTIAPRPADNALVTSFVERMTEGARHRRVGARPISR